MHTPPDATPKLRFVRHGKEHGAFHQRHRSVEAGVVPLKEDAVVGQQAALTDDSIEEMEDGLVGKSPSLAGRFFARARRVRKSCETN